MTSHEAAEFAGVTQGTIRRAMVKGHLKVTKIHCRKYSIEKSDLTDWMKARKTTKLFTRQKSSNPLNDRLTNFLTSLRGTPLEMDAETFITRVITQALDKLGG